MQVEFGQFLCDKVLRPSSILEAFTHPLTVKENAPGIALTVTIKIHIKSPKLKDEDKLL